jgi:hypothetical protein
MAAEDVLARLEARVAALEAEAGAARDERSVLDALLRYSRSIDLGLRAEWVDCFTADGVFDVRFPGDGAVPIRCAGRAELEAFIARHTAPPEVFHKHVYVMPAIAVDGDAATAAGYFIHLVDRDGEAIMQSYGRYTDQLRRGEDGRWRLTERRATVEAGGRGRA